MREHDPTWSDLDESGSDQIRLLLALWAKLGKGAHGQRGFHPLICHMLDVAGVTQALWNRVLTSAARRDLAAALGLREDAAGRWLGFFAGLHDLGKASPAFQSQDPEASRRLEGVGIPWPPHPTQVPHGIITAATLPELLVERTALSRSDAVVLATAVGGHHGRFPTSQECGRVPADAQGGGSWHGLRRAHVQALADQLALGPNRPGAPDGAATLVVAGLVSVADWIGSNAAYFPYAGEDATRVDFDLAKYWEQAQVQAGRALDALRWTGWPRASEPASFESLFPGLAPRPLQVAVAALAPRLREPGLVIIEAPMGEGKTEAALYLAEHWNAALEQQGLYLALPTQATSNQMFSRLRDFLTRRYPADFVNLHLLHGHAALSAEFEVLRQRGAVPFEPRDIHADADGHGPGSEGQVLAAEWFTHRKRGLLAPFGVGTIDQALLAVLQSRHVFVRLYGLAHKMVVIDEVHAYDTYMTALLTRLLEWLGALRSPVVLLSATLPRARRAALAAAYQRGLGTTPAVPPSSSTYPRLSWVTPAAGGTQAIAPSSPREVRVRHFEGQSPETGGESWNLGPHLHAALAPGGCAAIVCNTVARAQEVYRALKPLFPVTTEDAEPELDLLHARFLFDERSRREQRVLARFGKPGSGARPHRAVLVATQIIEQSLDLDFDLLVSELAPVDLVLQRVGRLHRHPRPRPHALAQAQLWVGHPPRSADGTPTFGDPNRAVYDHHVMLRSWLALRDQDRIRLPEDVEGLIEAVYDEDRPASAELSPPLRDLWNESLARQRRDLAADRREAEERWVRPPDYDYDGSLWRLVGSGLEEDAPDLHPAHQALTRLAEPSVPVVMLHGDPGRPALDPEGGPAIDPRVPPTLELATALLQRSVSLADRRLVHCLLAEPVPPGWRRSSLLRHHRLLILDAGRRTTVGRWTVRLDNETGVVVEPSPPEAR
jgi:CRISPR-associated endonuclease/helicase Cas3